MRREYLFDRVAIGLLPATCGKRHGEHAVSDVADVQVKSRALGAVSFTAYFFPKPIHFIYCYSFCLNAYFYSI